MFGSKEDGQQPEDPSIAAYQQDLAKGLFKNLTPETYVAYLNGEKMGEGLDDKQLLEQLIEQTGQTGFLITQPNMPKRVVHLRSPHILRWLKRD